MLSSITARTGYFCGADNGVEASKTKMTKIFNQKRTQINSTYLCVYSSTASTGVGGETRGEKGH